jgi:hypothetical protein
MTLHPTVLVILPQLANPYFPSAVGVATCPVKLEDENSPPLLTESDPFSKMGDTHANRGTT